VRSGLVLSFVEIVKGEPDIIVRAGVLFHDLAYVGRPETLSVLGEALASDARLPSSKGGANGPKEAQYALEALAVHVHGFPIEARGLAAMVMPKSPGPKSGWPNGRCDPSSSDRKLSLVSRQHSVQEQAFAQLSNVGPPIPLAHLPVHAPVPQ